jgi:hypothetical protein
MIDLERPKLIRSCLIDAAVLSKRLSNGQTSKVCERCRVMFCGRELGDKGWYLPPKFTPDVGKYFGCVRNQLVETVGVELV